jgi:hypothetical protein
MGERHKYDGRGHLLDDVSARPVQRADLALFDEAADALGALGVPTLLHKDATHERLFVAFFDGTGNDVARDREHMTNVADIFESFSGVNDPRVGIAYVEGPGTQLSRAKKLADSVTGASYDRRIQEIYDRLAAQVRAWLDEDPEADIRLLTTGFSRGAEQSVGLTRMVHEQGIALSGANGESRQLIPPGKVAQAVVLFDPVGTGHPQRHDRRLPPSVVSGLQIVARDERRSQFPSSTIIRQGITPDGRFLGVTVPGAHSDVGGSYHADALARASRALATDYVNSLSEQPFVLRPDLSSVISEYETRKSEDHSIIYDTRAFDRLGARDTRGPEAYPGHCRVVEECAPPEPVDLNLLDRMGPKHPVIVGPTPLDAVGREAAPEPPPLPAHTLYEQNQKAARAEETRADIARRELGPEASWADHYETTFPPGEERGHSDDFSKHLNPIHSSRDRQIEAPGHRHTTEAPDHRSIIEPSRSSPAHPHHRDHALYQSVHDQLTTLHAEEGITLSDQQMERLAHCSVAQARRCGLTQVTHMGLGQDKQGNIEPEVHMYQAFRGDLDDPRTKWGKVDALEAFQTPVEAASQDLQMANLQWDQMAQDRQVQLNQQQEQGMSMSR